MSHVGSCNIACATVLKRNKKEVPCVLKEVDDGSSVEYGPNEHTRIQNAPNEMCGNKKADLSHSRLQGQTRGEAVAPRSGKQLVLLDAERKARVD